ncbi:Hypothetical_protein [Hexamita inflata]|uniref:Hypothetical_protein n=1 Tax=Hexamita inflata TaxID=28002 RepID=A0AA86RB82_9EUKA|nr:Hypothetical protein HINF_LOCUS62869 [Hexamita inflata]
MTIHKSKLSYKLSYHKLISISYLIFQDCHSEQPPQTTQVSSALELTLLTSGVIFVTIFGMAGMNLGTSVQLWEVELLFLVYYVSNYILKYFATSNADDKFQQIISSWRLFMNYSLTQEGQKYDFDRIRPQSTIQSRYLIFQKGKIEITTCIKGRQ